MARFGQHFSATQQRQQAQQESGKTPLLYVVSVGIATAFLLALALSIAGLVILFASHTAPSIPDLSFSDGVGVAAITWTLASIWHGTQIRR